MSGVVTEKISIVIHPIERELLFELEPGFKRLPIDLVKKILDWSEPFSVSPIHGVKSACTGDVINGDLIMFPYLMEQAVGLGPVKAVNRLSKAVYLAQSSGAKLACLVAYTALVGKRGLKIQDRVRIPVTNGLNLTSATLPEAIRIAADKLDKKIKDMRVAIFGRSPITYLFLKSLGEARSFILYHSKKDALLAYCNALPKSIRAKTKILSRPPASALSNYDIVINGTPSVPPMFNEKHLKSGAIVLDMSYPRAIMLHRKDVLLMDGAAVIPPGDPRFDLNFGLPPGLCFPCMAEPMVLAFEKKFTSYSLGSDVNAEKANHIYALAQKHGFKLGPLTSYEHVIPPEKIDQVLKSIKKRTIFSIFGR